MGGGIVVLEDFFDPVSGLEGTRYTVTLAYSIGDLAALAVVTDGLSGVGISTTVVEVSMTRRSKCMTDNPLHPRSDAIL